MNIDDRTILLGAICLAGAVTCLVAEWREWPTTRRISKIAASSAFVGLAVLNGAAGSAYGRLILVALIFSWIGDVLLLSMRSTLFLGGITAFLFAHVGFAAAFASLKMDMTWLAAAIVIVGAAAAGLLRWLWPHLESFYKFAVPAYLAAIMIMTSLAIAASAASKSPLLAVAAVTFAISDVSVARDRFIANSIVNKVWGLPLYFAAQILFAMSVLSYH